MHRRVRPVNRAATKFAARGAVSYNHRMAPRLHSIYRRAPHARLTTPASPSALLGLAALVLGVFGANDLHAEEPVSPSAREAPHHAHAGHAHAGHSGDEQTRLVAIPDASPTVRRLLRNGGHARPGFDDVVWPDATELPYQQLVDPERYIPGTVSLGTTSDGRLVDGARIPVEGPTHAVLYEHRERDTHFATEELVQLVLDAGEHYAERYPGERIALGNFSHHSGGDIRWSRSHNSGRDADLAFPFVDEEGEPVVLETLVYASSRGVALNGSGHRVDFERAWTMVEGLLTSEAADVQWIFVYAPLKRRILEAGEAMGADPEVLEMARSVLHQPGDSAPHNDHFHIRIFCPRDDALEGCVDVGPEREHASDWTPLVEARVDELARGLMDPEPHVATACAGFLDRLNADERLADLARALPYQAPDAQIATIETLALEDEPGYAAAIVALAESSPSDAVREKAFWALGRLADRGTAAGLAGIVARGGAPLADGTPAREAAAHAMRNIPHEAAVEALVLALEDPRASVRAAVQHVLRRATLAADPHDAGVDLSPQAARELRAFWAKWVREELPLGRDAWLQRGFRAAGYAIGNPRDPDLDALVDALEDERDDLRFAADRLLVAHTPYWSPSERWTRVQRLRFWQARID